MKIKQILLIISCLAIIILSVSVAYYFAIFLPQQQKANIKLQNQIKELQEEVSATRESVEDRQYRPKVDTTEIQDRLDQIQSAMAEQQWEEEKRTNCESNGGLYEGNSICCLTCLK